MKLFFQRVAFSRNLSLPVRVVGCILLAAAFFAGGCSNQAKNPGGAAFPGVSLAASPAFSGSPAATSAVHLAAAGNEWTSFTVEVNGLAAKRRSQPARH
jgi:hypothetical protein